MATSKLPKHISSRKSGGQDVYGVVITTAGLRENLGTFNTLEIAVAARNRHIAKRLEQEALCLTSASAASLDSLQQAAQTEIVTEQYAPELLADWLEQLSFVDPTTLVAGKDYSLTHDITGKTMLIPGSVVTLAYNKVWGQLVKTPSVGCAS